jgi:micrococcal nuclease
MWKKMQIAAIVLVAGFIFAVVLENVAVHYGLGPHADDEPVAAPSDGPSNAPDQPGSSEGDSAAPAAPEDAQQMRATFVWDGDTIELQADESGEIVTTLAKIPVRLIGVDAPEIKSQLNDEPSQCFGEDAKQFLRELLPQGTPVLVGRDRDSWDDFDRRLLYVWRADDGRFINFEIVANGYAEAIRVWPNVEHWNEFEDSMSQAQRAGRGMWGAC